MRRFKITEEQYNYALSEGITLNADVAATNGDVKRAVDNTTRDAQKQGVNMDNANIQIKGSDMMEGKIVYKKQLNENRLKVLKEYSTLYTTDDFINKLK